MARVGANEPMVEVKDLMNALVTSQVQLREDFHALCQQLKNKQLCMPQAPQYNLKDWKIKWMKSMMSDTKTKWDGAIVIAPCNC